MRHALIIGLFTPTLLAQAASDAPSEARTRQSIGSDLAATVQAREAESGSDSGVRLRALQTAGTSAAAVLPVESLVAARLRDAVATAGVAEPAARVDRARELQARLTRIADDLRFEPLHQAPAPASWPMPAPVGDVVIKEYPAYRMATAPMRNEGDMSAFWKLFRHIQANDIPMTAPVQMDHAADTDGVMGERRAMAFLYEDDSRGQVGKAGKVEIVDVPAATWASMGARGYETQDSIDDLRSALVTWLRQHAPRYEVTGPMRVMGWNSPTVRGERRFYEVELPLRLRRAG